MTKKDKEIKIVSRNNPFTPLLTLTATNYCTIPSFVPN